jgi:Flp pilus assembly protein TadD
MAKSLIGILVATVVVGLQSPCAFADALADKGIEAYKTRDYGIALSTLQEAKQASPKDARVHYYLALTCQALNRSAEAEKEYRWTCEQGKDKDLKLKAYQGLQGLLASRGRTALAVRRTASAPRAVATQLPPGWLPAGSHSYKTESVAAPRVEQSFTRGCFKH